MRRAEGRPLNRPERSQGIGDLLGKILPFLDGATVEIRSRSGRVTITFSGTVPLPVPGLGDRHDLKRAVLEAEVSGADIVVRTLVVEFTSPLKRAAFSVWGGTGKLLGTLARKGLASGTLRSVRWGDGGQEGSLPATFRFS
jgi:hypothetical protein